MPSPTEAVAAELAACRRDPDRFNSTILGRPPYWSRQREICRSIVRYPITLCPAGNAVGKSFLAAGLLHWFLLSHPGSMVLATAPSQTQLEEVLWKQVEKAYHGSRVPLGGRALRSPLKIDLGGEWQALAYSTTKTERLSGHHRGEMLVIADEASGVEDPIYEALDSCNPSRMFLPGNPLRPSGVFYDRCTQAEEKKHDPDRLSNLVRISSLESPDIDEVRSARGMADRTWLEKSRNDYGEESIWWKSHVLALFPDSASDTVFPRDWLNRCGRAEHFAGGRRRIAIDLGEGNGGDKSVVLCRDDNGLLDLKSSPNWDLGRTAKEAAAMLARWRVQPRDVSFDIGGPGADFRNRLAVEGIEGARAYRGGAEGGDKFGNLRSASAWKARQRLDPGRQVDQGGLWVPQVPFAIRPDFLALLRPELQAIRWEPDERGRPCLEAKKDLAKRLKHSPDFADAFCQSFAFP